MRRWLLVRRSTDEPAGLGFYRAYGPEGTAFEELVEVCQERWAVEKCFAEARGGVGLDHYEGRRWDAWHRHPMLAGLRLPGLRSLGRPRGRRPRKREISARV
jgi:SRSO17 transposase